MSLLKKSMLLIFICFNIVIFGACRGGEEGPAERAGKQIDQAVEKAGQKVEEAKKKVSEEAAEAQKKLGEKMEEAGKSIKKNAD
jgi:sRNA-binding protein